jgi:heat shock protein HslJ
MRSPLPAIAFCCLLLAGCTMAPLVSTPTPLPLPPSEAASARPSPTAMSSGADPEVWRLRQVRSGALDAAAVREAMGETTVTLDDADTATGTAGCRTFEADYELENTQSISITALSVDESACPAPQPGLDDFVAFVTAAPVRAEFAPGLLTLSTRDGAYSMVFESVEGG